MVVRKNMTPPRVRIAEGGNADALVRQVYYADRIGNRRMQLDKTNVRVNRSGELIGKPVGLTGIGPDHVEPQFPEDYGGPGYLDPTAPDWRRGMGKGQAEGKPGFDHSKPRKRR